MMNIIHVLGSKYKLSKEWIRKTKQNCSLKDNNLENIFKSINIGKKNYSMLLFNFLFLGIKLATFKKIQTNNIYFHLFLPNFIKCTTLIVVLNNDKNFFEFKAAYYYCSLIVLLSVVYFSAVDSVCHNLLISLS